MTAITIWWRAGLGATCPVVSLRALLGGKPLFHGRVRQPLVAEGNGVALLCHEAATLEELLRAIADVGGQARRAARARELLQRVDQHAADPLPGGRGMNVEHVDALGTGKRCEPDRRSVDGAEQGQRVGEPRGEGGFVVRHGRPGLLLARAVVVGGQLGDAGAEDFSQQRRVRRQERPQCKLRLYARRHRDTFQVVLPSLWSSSSTPIALSSSRMRSAFLKLFALRAALRASMSAFTLSASTTRR